RRWIVFGLPGMTATAFIRSLDWLVRVVLSSFNACIFSLLDFFVIQKLPRSHSFATLLDQFGHESSPTGLVTGADSCAVIAVKILVEVDEVAPVRVVLEFV